ncbi:hypothetical protein [Aliirhizobium cellulosilyticum]|uniref:Uncharacterized protein n=1 Tax=Aliirhizobium cellulosilyticum TaxID=393664 RepID=A0A7W6S5R8_9HYPH|nr:hypothetical protein [Rhizobium cellulosilyticum]MBB4347723.1 hypothetical protein [Rhizobium cellulosilyticum]MBB4409883.1 hypothetical protein [Rhizobium cellulosilyticum]MBB4444570.1 hypothetical protein [Rhizobium cellulosilyticum]
MVIIDDVKLYTDKADGTLIKTARRAGLRRIDEIHNPERVKLEERI